MRPPAHRSAAGGNPLTTAMMPMIDVVFLLLVFFLCTASFEEPEQNLAASLRVAQLDPGAGTESAPPELDDVTIVGRVVGESMTWTVNAGRSTASLGELTSLLGQLATIDRGLPVTIDAGPRVPMRDVVGAYDAAREAGFGRVLLTTDPLPTGETSP
ncbi:MAG: biopolymer transporter ExbD [Planctomycetota bacterium]